MRFVYQEKARAAVLMPNSRIDGKERHQIELVTQRGAA